MKIAKSDWVVIIVFCVVLQMLSFWCIDISVSAIISGGKVVNLWTTMNPIDSYHLGIYLSILNFVFLIFITVHHILREKPNKKEKHKRIDNGKSVTNPNDPGGPYSGTKIKEKQSKEELKEEVKK
jgi:hypothetical protein